MAKLSEIQDVRPTVGLPRRYILVLEEIRGPGMPSADLRAAIRQLAKLARRNFSLSAAELRVFTEDEDEVRG